MAFKMKYGKTGFPFKQKDSWVVEAGKLGKTDDGFNVADKDKNYSVSKEEYETYIKENNSSDPFKQNIIGGITKEKEIKAFDMPIDWSLPRKYSGPPELHESQKIKKENNSSDPFKQTYPEGYTDEDIKFLKEQKEEVVNYWDLDDKGKEIWRKQGKQIPKKKQIFE